MLDFQIPRITSESVEEARRGSFTIEPLDRGFGYKVGSIFNQLRIYPEDAFQGQLQLLGGVVGRLQSQYGRADEFLKRLDIAEDGWPDGEEHGTRVEGSEYQDQGIGQ